MSAGARPLPMAPSGCALDDRQLAEQLARYRHLSASVLRVERNRPQGADPVSRSSRDRIVGADIGDRARLLRLLHPRLPGIAARPGDRHRPRAQRRAVRAAGRADPVLLARLSAITPERHQRPDRLSDLERVPSETHPCSMTPRGSASLIDYSHDRWEGWRRMRNAARLVPDWRDCWGAGQRSPVPRSPTRRSSRQGRRTVRRSCRAPRPAPGRSDARICARRWRRPQATMARRSSSRPAPTLCPLGSSRSTRGSTARTIAGAGSNQTTIAQSPGAGQRVIKFVSSSATVSISGVTVTGVIRQRSTAAARPRPAKSTAGDLQRGHADAGGRDGVGEPGGRWHRRERDLGHRGRWRGGRRRRDLQ